MSFFVETLASSPWEYFSWVLIIAFSICVHEFSHAWTALRYGDDTAARSGYLTLNPMVQMGPMSIILLLLFGMAWGQVPVNPGNLRRIDRAKVAFAGPAANLALAAVFALLTAIAFRLTGHTDASPAVALLAVAAHANAVLFVLNMLPIPIFDGWSVLEGFFPRMDDIRQRMGPQFAWILLLVVLATPVLGFVWAIGRGLSVALIAAFSLLMPG